MKLHKHISTLLHISLLSFVLWCTLHSYYSDAPMEETLRWFWSLLIILIIHWFVFNSKKLLHNFSNDTQRILERYQNLIEVQDEAIKKQNEVIEHYANHYNTK